MWNNSRREMYISTSLNCYVTVHIDRRKKKYSRSQTHTRLNKIFSNGKKNEVTKRKNNKKKIIFFCTETRRVNDNFFFRSYSSLVSFAVNVPTRVRLTHIQMEWFSSARSFLTFAAKTKQKKNAWRQMVGKTCEHTHARTHELSNTPRVTHGLTLFLMWESQGHLYK